MKEMFSDVVADKRVIETFFGDFEIPSRTHSISIDYNKKREIPVGRIAVPGLPIEMNITLDFQGNNEFPMEGRLYVNFKYKRKYEPVIKDIEKAARKRHKTQSIFKGKAVDSSWEFIDITTDTSKMVYSQQEYAELDANIFTPIADVKGQMKDDIPIKRNILLSGSYGTGKTMTAAKAAQLCVENGWTYINVLPGDSIVRALGYAKKYEPCLVFFEDVDIETEGRERNVDINKVLDAVDGMLSKSNQVMVILTTNRIGVIHPAMLRQGRIDATIEVGRLDEDAVARMVSVYANCGLGETLTDDEKQDIYVAAEGYPPAFIVGAVQNARLYRRAAKRRDGDTSDGVDVTPEDIIRALNELRYQFDMMMAAENSDDEGLTTDKALRQVAYEAAKEATDESNANIVSDVEKMIRNNF
jgi:transitional endoplasmic reticulum ATPase